MSCTFYPGISPGPLPSSSRSLVGDPLAAPRSLGYLSSSPNLPTWGSKSWLLGRIPVSSASTGVGPHWVMLLLFYSVIQIFLSVRFRDCRTVWEKCNGRDEGNKPRVSEHQNMSGLCFCQFSSHCKAGGLNFGHVYTSCSNSEIAAKKWALLICTCSALVTGRKKLLYLLFSVCRDGLSPACAVLSTLGNAPATTIHHSLFMQLMQNVSEWRMGLVSFGGHFRIIPLE